MFKKKIKILGISVPTVLVVALVATSMVAFGAYLLQLVASGSVQSASAPSGDLSNIVCSMSGKGQFDSCELPDTHTMAYAISGVDDESAGVIEVDYTSNYWDGSQTLHFSDGAIPEVTIACTVIWYGGADPSAPCDGFNVGMGETAKVQFDLDFSAMPADTSIDPLTWVLEAENN